MRPAESISRWILQAGTEWHSAEHYRRTARNAALPQCRPATYAFGTFVELWRELGGEFTGKLRIEAAPADARALLSFDSLSLAEIVRLTNKFSNNLMARHLLLTMGGERLGYPATLEKGAAAITAWSRERGLDLQGVDIDNGSGLSRITHISVLQMAQILRAAEHSPYARNFSPRCRWPESTAHCGPA